MERVAYPRTVDYAPFARDNETPEARYGLPRDVVFCRRCVVSNQRPNSVVEFLHTSKSRKKTIHFDEHGICDACRFAERKSNAIDWRDRERMLRELCDRHRSKDGSYDCIVPGSGGKDSFFASHILTHEYGMQPLTVTWSPHIYTDWGWRNFQSWVRSGQGNYRVTANERVNRLLTRLSTELLLHPFQAFMIGQKALAPKSALLFDIPLVFYGENEAEYGNPIGDADTAERNPTYFSLADQAKVHLGGVSIAELESQFGLQQSDLLPYLPADPDQLRENKIEVHYLGYYLKWHPQSKYYYAVEHGGFEAAPARNPGTYSKYNSIDDRIDDFHYHTTGIKFGIGRATYDAAQEIRSGDITRDEAVALVERFDHEFPERFAEEIFRYLSIPESEFPIASRMFEQPRMDRAYYERLVDNFRSPHLWVREADRWYLRHAVWHAERAIAT